MLCIQCGTGMTNVNGQKIETLKKPEPRKKKEKAMG
jgi:hypothetical protein